MGLTIGHQGVASTRNGPASGPPPYARLLPLQGRSQAANRAAGPATGAARRTDVFVPRPMGGPAATVATGPSPIERAFAAARNHEAATPLHAPLTGKTEFQAAGAEPPTSGPVKDGHQTAAAAESTVGSAGTPLQVAAAAAKQTKLREITSLPTTMVAKKATEGDPKSEEFAGHVGLATDGAVGGTAAYAQLMRKPLFHAARRMSPTLAAKAVASKAGIAGRIAASPTLTRAAEVSGPLRRGLSGGAHVVGIALPALAATTGALHANKVIDRQGPQALVTTASGRSAALQMTGAVMLLGKPPAVKLGGAALLATAAANDLGAFDHLGKDPKRTEPSRK